MRKPPELTEHEWDMLTSPENYWGDGEYTRVQAEQVLRQRAHALVDRKRRAAGGRDQRCQALTTDRRRCSRNALTGGLCRQHAAILRQRPRR